MWSEMYLGFHVITFYAYSIVMKLEFSRQIFEKYLNIKFYAYPVEAELFHADERTDIQTYMKLIVAFRNFANAPKKACAIDMLYVSVRACA
jgi:hypothetical protein